MVKFERDACPKRKSISIEILGFCFFLVTTNNPSCLVSRLHSMDRFKVPQNIPQDLLLIQEFIGVPNPTPSPQQEDEINSSDNDSETVSEDEIAADLIKGTDEDASTTQIVEKTFGFLPS